MPEFSVCWDSICYCNRFGCIAFWGICAAMTFKNTVIRALIDEICDDEGFEIDGREMINECMLHHCLKKGLNIKGDGEGGG